MDEFIDLGAGFFLFEEDYERKSVICDGMSSNPDHNFGPAAWSGKGGPISGKTVIEATALLRGGWEQTGDDTWAWFSDSGQEFADEPASWPRVVVVTDDSVRFTFESIAGMTVACVEDLVSLVCGLTSLMPQRRLPEAGPSARLSAVKFRHPHIFGDESSSEASVLKATH